MSLTPEGFPKPGVLEHSHTVLTAYGGAKLMQHWKCQITYDLRGKKSVATFLVKRTKQIDQTSLGYQHPWNSTLSP